MAEPSIIPKEALAWLKSKKLKPGFDHRDVWRDEQSVGFTVAKMTQLDLLQDVKTILEEALETGQTFAQFRETLKPLLVKRGWWGMQMMDDPLTQETRAVQLGSDRRLRTIYDTNMRTARSAASGSVSNAPNAPCPICFTRWVRRASTGTNTSNGLTSACQSMTPSGLRTSAPTAGAVNAGCDRSVSLSTSNCSRMASPAPCSSSMTTANRQAMSRAVLCRCVPKHRQSIG